MKIAYKGFGKNLTCRREQFAVGETYSKNTSLKSPKLCSSDGYHYCNQLTDVFQFYANGGSNRFCEIEVLGSFTEDSVKGITTSFRIIKELSKIEIAEAVLESRFNLPLLRTLQQKYPMFHVGGSTGLFLHGVRLNRWGSKDTSSDFDFVSPYYVLPESDKDLNVDIEYEDKASNNDFDYTFGVNGTKIDYKIDPKQKYEYVEYKGFKYKVSPLINIIEAKVRYAMQPNGSKHLKDIKEMTTGKIEEIKTYGTEDTPFGL